MIIKGIVHVDVEVAKAGHLFDCLISTVKQCAAYALNGLLRLRILLCQHWRIGGAFEERKNAVSIAEIRSNASHTKVAFLSEISPSITQRIAIECFLG